MRVVLSLSLILLLSACGDSPPSKGQASSGGSGKRLIGVSFQTMNNPFFVELNEGLKEIVEAHGDTLRTLDAQYTGSKQLNDISDLVQQNAAVIFINPVQWDGIKGSLNKAKGINIP